MSIRVYPFYYPDRACLCLTMLNTNKNSDAEYIKLDLLDTDSAERVYEVFSQGYRFLKYDELPKEKWSFFPENSSYLTYL